MRRKMFTGSGAAFAVAAGLCLVLGSGRWAQAGNVRVIVTFADTADAGVIRGAGGQVVLQVGHGAVAAVLPARAITALQRRASVASVRADGIVTALKGKPGGGGGAKTPAPPPAQSLPTGAARIGLDQSSAADYAGGTAMMDVDIAIIDTGIDLTHPDLNVAGSVNFVRVGKSGNDDNGHGSHVAGTAAAINNTIGTVGIAPGARLWAVKVLDRRGTGFMSGITAGVNWVTDRGDIEVANMSLSASGNDQAFDDAITASVAAGVTHVVAAGNKSADASTASPANHPDVITVSAIADSDGQPGGLGPATSRGDDDTFATFSNYGSLVEIAAPGVDIYSTWKDGGYNTISGTSMASPHVAGAAALYIVANPGLTPAQVGAALTGSATPQGDADGFTGDPDLPDYPEPLLNVSSF